jgi:hypothetical protein
MRIIIINIFGAKYEEKIGPRRFALANSHPSKTAAKVSGGAGTAQRGH